MVGILSSIFNLDDLGMYPCGISPNALVNAAGVRGTGEKFCLKSEKDYAKSVSEREYPGNRIRQCQWLNLSTTRKGNVEYPASGVFVRGEGQWWGHTDAGGSVAPSPQACDRHQLIPLGTFGPRKFHLLFNGSHRPGGVFDAKISSTGLNRSNRWMDQFSVTGRPALLSVRSVLFTCPSTFVNGTMGLRSGFPGLPDASGWPPCFKDVASRKQNKINGVLSMSDGLAEKIS